MRDPVIYRIQKEIAHHRTENEWSIYPTYDMAHSLSDSIETITHSLCSGEFFERRPLYEWFIENVDAPSTPRQIEYARVALSYTILSKRRLRQLIEEGHVSGWDDPRMPTLSGLRRRGYPAQAIREFCREIGMTTGEGGRSRSIQLAVLEHAVREELNTNAPRAMAVIDPLRVVIENYPEEESEDFEAQNHPQNPDHGTRSVPFSRILYIEREDFIEDPPKKFFRLAPGREVRLRYAYFITCTDVVKDGDRIVELRCTYDPATRGGDSPDGRKVKGTLHWVSAAHAIPAEVRLYDTLFAHEDPAKATEDGSLSDALNPESLKTASAAQVEPSLANTAPGTSVQFERLGYFCVDPDSESGALVFNRTVSSRDNWAKSANRPKK